MSLQVLGSGVFLREELKDYALPPSWRKATRNMIFATVSIERALAQTTGLKVAGNENVAFVLGTSSGELETSAEFMINWSKSRLARPLLFQNSLHNATTGFASIHFQLTGPSFTVSAMQNTPSECVQMARTLLREKICGVCIVTLVEAHLSLATRIGESAVQEGACSVVLSNHENIALFGLHARATLNEAVEQIDYPQEQVHAPLVGIDESGLFQQIQKIKVAF